ncbi:queuosine 5'-phosphate N-glycosylase/hydrolase [Topomyia yanbarensis]|uniref:queuosine 5'-phosphate N-glycosylase/hydrolase n=1 Tax=Topomyia yanbarensis TaxID=2498891 RepID=UPI00273C4BEE|nr:queuosine 5'-phosphate N-glycosylase/hydrolase [Topomyia yanbarensis]
MLSKTLKARFLFWDCLVQQCTAFSLRFLRSKFEFIKMVTLSPAESGEFIVKHATFLKVNETAIQNLVKEVINGIQTKVIDVNNFSQHEYHPKPTDSHAANWIFLIDTLNFCFWTPGNATKWKVEGQTGYFSLCAAVNRALKEGIDITNPTYYSKITLEELEQILRSDDGNTKAPLLQERVECLHEVGKVLLEKYDGKFENCVKACSNSAVALLKLVVEEFPCFRDEATYNGQRVSIYKRAQILIGDLWACFRGEGLGYFHDIERVTMFADYRVPQVLVHFKTIEYTDELLEVLKMDKILPNGCPEEVEIRGASIYVVERLKELVLAELKANHQDISVEHLNAVLLDHFLWDYRRKHAAELEYIPFHKTISVYY